MNNLKVKNIKNAIWHIKRHCEAIQNCPIEQLGDSKLFMLQGSVDCLKRIIHDEKPYLGIDREEVF